MSSLARHNDERWQDHAACAGGKGAVFYPPMRPEKKSQRRAREEQAKAVCAGCRVRQECLDHAITHGERYGIWGGMTDNERRHLYLV